MGSSNPQQAGLALLPSKTKPGQRRWQRPGGKPPAKNVGAMRDEFVAKYRAKREAEKAKLEQLLKREAGDLELFGGKEITRRKLTAAAKRLKVIKAEEAKEAKVDAKRKKVVEERTAAKQTDLFGGGGPKKGQAQLFADRDIDEAHVPDKPSAFSLRHRKLPPHQSALLLSRDPLVIVPVRPRPLTA